MVLTHSILVDPSTVTICSTSPFIILGMSGLFFRFVLFFDGNNVNPDQMPHDVASDVGQHWFAFDLFTGFLVRMG